jgi:hypothetical protein
MITLDCSRLDAAVYYETDLAAYSGDLTAVQRNLATLAHTTEYSSTRALLWASFGNQLHVRESVTSTYSDKQHHRVL